jgi:MraZ protein
VARFFGRYEHTLDDKGRVTLPAKFRVAFERSGYLTQFHDGCLALWTPEEFEQQMASMQQRAAGGRGDRNLARVWAAGSHEVETDRQGRMAIPAHLREYAGLQGDVLVHGAIDRVELWDPTRWEEKVKPEEIRLTEGIDE